MVPIKAILTGLVGVSLCVANISGTVTDTGSTPIPGAVVQLEKSGWTATTGANGSFTLVPTAILPGKDKLLPNGLSARISGNLMTLTIAERVAVEVATFDLTGRVLSTVRNTIDAGTHSIVLPYRGAGIYLYKVKSGNRELLLKSNSIGFSSVTTQDLSSNHLVKQAKATAAINDVITATKTGYLNYQCVQYTSDTTGLILKMITSAGTLTDINGNAYQTVKIGNQIWTVENLRVTKLNDGTAIPLVTSTATWDSAWENGLTIPAYCYYNNITNTDSISKWGALYNWYAVNTGKLAPKGWHVPTDSEWEVMQNYLVINGYNYDGTTDTTINRIAMALTARTDWTTDIWAGDPGNKLTTMNNNSGFSALPSGCRSDGHNNQDGYNVDFSGQSGSGDWWSSSEVDAVNAWVRDLSYNRVSLIEYYYYKSCGFSVRLVRDN